MPVNRPAVQALVAALRSGQYRQGVRALVIRAETGELSYCCLGVACVVAAEAGVGVRMLDDGTGASPSFITANGNVHTIQLPEVVANHYGFETNPDITFIGQRGGVFTLLATDANDDYRYTFEQIADAFERTYLAGDDDADQ